MMIMLVLIGDKSHIWSCLTFSDPRDRLEKLLKQPANKYCADCGSPEPKWVYVDRFTCVAFLHYLLFMD